MESPLLRAELSGCVVTTSPVQAEHRVTRDPSGGGDVTDTGDELWSCSGVIVDAGAGVALCQAAVFFPFLKKSPFSYSDRSVLLATDFLPDLSVWVEFPFKFATDAQSGARANSGGWDKSSGPALGLAPTSVSGRRRARRRADLLMLVPCPEFQATVSRLFRAEDGWTFSNEDEKEYGEFRKDLAYLHWFAVLKLQSPPRGRAKTKLDVKSASDLVKGCPVFACGSPFGSFYPDIFLNTVSKGVLSNVAGEGNVVLLTDARCLPGSEGGGLYVLENGRLFLVGVAVVPLCWKSNEWVGLTLACSVSHILENIRRRLGGADIEAKSDLAALSMASGIADKPRRGAGPLDRLMAAVVVVDSGQSWGSGVLIKSDLVLTCRHVVRHSSTVSVKIWMANKKQPHWIYDRCRPVRGQVVFSSKDSSPYDVAVVKLEKDVLGVPEPVLASGYGVGQDVCVVGFGALGERCGPSVTSGVLSAVISVGDVPVMLQTTCAVHGGSSGGPLFNIRSGELLGIVASNTKDNSTGATYPHLNFSIPITILRDAVDRCKQSEDLKGFEELNEAGAAAQNVWRLQRSPGSLFQSKL